VGLVVPNLASSVGLGDVRGSLAVLVLASHTDCVQPYLVVGSEVLVGDARSLLLVEPTIHDGVPGLLHKVHG